MVFQIDKEFIKEHPEFKENLNEWAYIIKGVIFWEYKTEREAKHSYHPTVGELTFGREVKGGSKAQQTRIRKLH